MSRALLRTTILDRNGNVQAGVTVHVYEPGTTTHIAAAMHSALTGGSVLTNPLTTDANGGVTAFLDAAQNVDLLVVEGTVQRTVPAVAGGSGGGSLPSWWTVDSTPGAESVGFAGQVTITPNGLYGLLIHAQAGFYNVFDSFLKIIDEHGVELFRLDDGGYTAISPAGVSPTRARFLDTDTGDDSTYGAAEMVIASRIRAGPAHGYEINAFVPSVVPGTNFLQIYYDSTPGAAKLRIRAKDDNGLDVTGSVALA